METVTVTNMVTIDHYQETGDALSNDDVISCLRRHLATEVNIDHFFCNRKV